MITLSVVLIVALVVAFVVVFVGWLIRAGSAAAKTAGPARPDPSERARRILAERYARGELLPEEYRERVGTFP